MDGRRHNDVHRLDRGHGARCAGRARLPGVLADGLHPVVAERLAQQAVTSVPPLPIPLAAKGEDGATRQDRARPLRGDHASAVVEVRAGA